MLYLKITPQFIQNFLTPLANITDKVSLYIKDGKVTTCGMGGEGMVAYRYISEIDTNIEDELICISDLVRFKNLLNGSIDFDDNDKLEYVNNMLKYKSSRYKFKYYLMDSDIMGDSMSFSEDSIKNFQEEKSFIIKQEDLKSIIRTKSLHKIADISKVYFKFESDGVKVAITDHSIPNVDEIELFITDKYNGDEMQTPLPVTFDLIKFMAQHRGLPFKIKYSGGKFLILTKTDEVNIAYVTSLLQN
jgi:hypothetical protein